MSDHHQQASDAERELHDMEERSERLEDDIADVREDWERKKADDGVPGAAGQPEQAEGDLPPEADYTTPGD
jgi:predicted  nucleic acid-binding Zn-ribbon protein